LEKDWDDENKKVRKSHPNSTRLNNFLIKKIAEANDIILEADSENKAISSKEIKKKIANKGKNISFFNVAAERIKDKYERKVFSVAKSELSILHNIEEFLNLDKSQNTENVIASIKERRKARIIKGLKSKAPLTDTIEIFKKKKTLYFSDIDSAFLKKFKNFFCISQSKNTHHHQSTYIHTHPI